MKQHREHSLIKSGQTGLAEKLRQSMNNLVVDVWGLENKTVNSLNEYFERVSIEKKLPKEHFMIRVRNNDFLLIELLHKNEIQFPIVVRELFQLLNIPIVKPSDFEKLANRIRQFLNAHAVGQNNVLLYLNVQVMNQKVRFHLMNQEELLKTYSFQELISKLSI